MWFMQDDGGVIIVKVMYGLDIVWFKFLRNIFFVVLKDEVGWRLKLVGQNFNFKYLDDDEEWMLFVCVVDFQESIDLMCVFGWYVIKFMICFGNGL